MAWSVPMTAVPNQSPSAADLNKFIRDNFRLTAPAIATTAGSHFVVTDKNTIVERLTTQATVATSETTTSATFTDLTTPGPSITITTGTKALVVVTAQLSNNTVDAFAAAGVRLSGATNADPPATLISTIFSDAKGAGEPEISSNAHLYQALNAGVNTFKMQYKVGASGTGTFSNRVLIVMPF